MDTPFIIAVALTLCLLSAMIAIRMAAGGIARARIAVSLVELWLTVAIWIAVFRTIGETTGARAGSGEPAGLRNLASLLAGLSGSDRLWVLLGGATAIILAVHLMWSLSRTKYVGIRS